MKSHIDLDGTLRLQMPNAAWDADCEVIVLYEPRRKMSKSEWARFINETYGSLADTPLERGEELPEPIRD